MEDLNKVDDLVVLMKDILSPAKELAKENRSRTKLAMLGHAQDDFTYQVRKMMYQIGQTPKLQDKYVK